MFCAEATVTTTDIWIGSLEDPSFSWQGGDWSGNTPKAISPRFPPISQSKAGRYADWLKSGSIDDKQTDWGAWVAKATGTQLVQLLELVYEGDEELPWVVCDLPELKAFVKTLDPKKLYALVTAEW
jgi:hypothetical protein